MIRAAFILTLALTVAAGESAMLVCQAVCDREVETGDHACRHTESAAPASMNDDEDCLDLGLPATATLRVEIDRPDSHGMTTVAVSNAQGLTAFGRLSAATVSRLPSGSPPRTDVLRI